MSDAAPVSGSVVQAQPLIAVRSVRASSHWYADLLDADANLVDPDAVPPGHGVVLWFQVEDFDAAVDRVRELDAEIIDGPLVNPAPHREVWLRDPDRYVVVIASADGEARSGHR